MFLSWSFVIGFISCFIFEAPSIVCNFHSSFLQSNCTDVILFHYFLAGLSLFFSPASSFLCINSHWLLVFVIICSISLLLLKDLLLITPASLISCIWVLLLMPDTNIFSLASSIQRTIFQISFSNERARRVFPGNPSKNKKSFSYCAVMNFNLPTEVCGVLDAVQIIFTVVCYYLSQTGGL